MKNTKNIDRAAPLSKLLKTHPETAPDYLEFRFVAEAFAAECAAKNATEEERKAINNAFQKIESLVGQNNADAECQADQDFHMAIYQASHNDVLDYVMQSLFSLIHRDVFYHHAHFRALEGVHDFLFRQHKAIHDAIMAGDAERARFVAEKHVRYIKDSLEESRIAEQRFELADRRLRRAGIAQGCSLLP